MAERRMFAKTIVTSDAFLDMPPTARCLYFTLAMFADDDGFVNNPKSIMRQVGSTTDDMNILIAKKFVLVFESGVIVIKHWKIHNYIQSDRYHPTKYQEELSSLFLDENKAYTQLDTECIHDVSKVDTEVRLEIGKSKDRLGYSILSKEFEDLWQIYPKKQGKQNAFKAYEKARREGVEYEDVLNGIKAYAEYAKTKDPQYIKMGSSFFNQRAWQDDWSIKDGRKGFNEYGNEPSQDGFGAEPEGWDTIFGA